MFFHFWAITNSRISSIIRVPSCHLQNMLWICFIKAENNFKFLEGVSSKLLFCKKFFEVRINSFNGHLSFLDFVFVFDSMIVLVFTLFTLFIAQERGTDCWRCLRSSPRSARHPRPGRQSIEMALIAFFSRKSWLHFFLQNHLKSFDRLAFSPGSHSVPRLSDCFVWVPSLSAGVKSVKKWWSYLWRRRFFLGRTFLCSKPWISLHCLQPTSFDDFNSRFLKRS